MTRARAVLRTFIVLSIAWSLTAASARADNCGERAVLVEGTGIYSRPIPTESKLAQQFFDQGLRLAYGFYFPEAIASLQEALCHDPGNPMIHWGLALAIAPNPNSRYRAFPDDPLGEGRKSIRTAKAGAAGLTSVERGLIEALDVLLDSDAERDAKARSDGFVEVAGRVFRRHPSDLEAAFLYGYAIMTHSQWAYWDADGKPYPRTLEAVEALERVMKNHPLHPGGNHLYIHLMEDSKEPQRALPQADRLEAIMPKAGHVVHMPSHIYMRVGQYQKAIQSNLRSVEADRYFLDVWGAAPFPQIGTYHLSAKTHFRHAHSFRRWAAMLQGDYRQAMEAARAAATIPREKWNSGGAQRTISTVWLTQSAFGKWHEVLATPQPPEEYPLRFHFTLA